MKPVRMTLTPDFGWLTVASEPKGLPVLAAEVWLDDVRIGTTPLAKQVLIGQHRLKVVDGGRQVEQNVVVTEKQIEDIAVELKGGVRKSGSSGGAGTWTDSKSGLTWQVTPTGGTMNWSKAKAHCAGLTLAGGGWHLPTIGELRTLLRGCPGSVTGEACKASDSCLSSSCWDRGACWSCSNGNGPADGCYWPDEMQGTCGWYWSSSPVEDSGDRAWGVNFRNGYVINYYVYRDKHVRCVR